MFDVYDAHNKLASYALLSDAIAFLIVAPGWGSSLWGDEALNSPDYYIVERETNITLAIDKDANKLRFMLGAKGN